MPIVDRWAVINDFTPNSSDQVKAYFSHKGYKIPKHRSDSSKETTNNEALEALMYRYPDDKVLPLIVESRHLKTGIGFLADTFLGMDSRFHPLYTYLPKTGRLSSKAPNLMNLPQGKKGDIMAEIALAIRSAIIPDPGHLMVEVDWNAIEAVLTGFFAGDDDYIKAAKIGIHDIFGSHLLAADGIITSPKAASDPDIVEWIKWFKANHDNVRQKAKRRIYAGSYGQGVFNMAKDLGVTIAEVRRLDKIFDTMAPKVARWKKEMRLRAHKEKMLTNPFGYVMQFFDVIKEVDGAWKLGSEANEVLSFLPQSSGAAMLKEVLLDLGNHPDEGNTFSLLIPTHDSIAAQVKEDHLDEVMEIIRKSMERAWPELDGLVVEVEGKVGPSLSKEEMSTYNFRRN